MSKGNGTAGRCFGLRRTRFSCQGRRWTTSISAVFCAILVCAQPATSRAEAPKPVQAKAAKDVDVPRAVPNGTPPMANGPAAQASARMGTSGVTSEGAYIHDGFYVRLGVGGGYLLGSWSESDGSLGVQAASLPFELAIGATIPPGLVLGAGIFPVAAVAPSFEREGQTHILSSARMATFVVGPVVDLYPNPAKGIHVQGAAGYGLSTIGGTYANAASTWSVDTTGLGIMGGIGYEVWFDEQWSYGGLLRLTYVDTQGSDVGRDATVGALAIGVLGTFTYH